jgi:hypothetical protein
VRWRTSSWWPAPRPPAPAPGSDRTAPVHDRRDPADSFARTWRSFDRLQRGEAIAQRASGEMLSAPEDGYIVFPNPNALPGREWFYFARHSDRVVE